MAEKEQAAKHWSGTGKLRGGRGGILFFILVLRHLGVGVAYFCAVFPAIWFSFTSPDIKATMDYHRRVFGHVPWWKRRWLIFRHFYAFGRSIIDRTAILAGATRGFSFEFDGEHHIRQALTEGRGCLLLSAHVGNWEAAGQLLGRIDVQVNITGLDNENREIRDLLTSATKQKFKLLPLTGSPTDVIPLVAALRRGELVAMLGDRPYGSPTVRVPFLGGTASFPIGAYVIAAIANAPLVMVFSLREPGGHYHFFGFPPMNLTMPPHNQRDAYLKSCAERFAAELEKIVRRDPLQWYNFFPFWDDPAKAAPPATPATLPPNASNET